MFKKRRGIHIPYNRQGLIHFICVNYEDMPDKIRGKIDRLCDEIGGEDAEALFEVLTNDTKPIYGIAKASNNRIQGWYNLKEALKVYTDEQGIETAQLKIFKNCTNLLRTLPQVQHDEKEPNDIAKEPHELTHAPDALRYFIAGRPSRNIEKKKEVKYNFEAERPADINRYTCERDIVV